MKPKGAQKIAAVLLGIDKDSASALLKDLPEAPLEAISQAMVELSTNPTFQPTDTDAPLNEYWTRIEEGSAGVNDFHDLLNDALGDEKAEEQLQRLSVSRKGDPFSPLERLPPRDVADVLMDENEQVCALALSAMKPGSAAKVLEHVDAEKRASVVRRIAGLTPPARPLQEKVARSLLDKFGPTPPQTPVASKGVGIAASILNFLSEETERDLAEGLQGDDEELYQAIDERRVTMDDLVGIDKKSMQKVLAGVDTRTLTVALKGASKEIEAAILENVSKRSRETILEERELLGALPVTEVEGARKELLTQVRALIKTGDVVLRRSGDDDVIE